MCVGERVEILANCVLELSEDDGINVQLLAFEVLTHLLLHLVNSPAMGITLEWQETTTGWSTYHCR